jgi:hypothetical protein
MECSSVSLKSLSHRHRRYGMYTDTAKHTAEEGSCRPALDHAMHACRLFSDTPVTVQINLSTVSQTDHGGVLSGFFLAAVSSQKRARFFVFYTGGLRSMGELIFRLHRGCEELQPRKERLTTTLSDVQYSS